MDGCTDERISERAGGRSDDSLRNGIGNRVHHRPRQPRPGEPEHDRGPERGLSLPDGWLFGLFVPAETDRPCALLMLRDQATSLSDALGGVLLDETAVDGRPTHRCWLYLDVARHTRRLTRNRRLHHLAADLGWPCDRSGDWLGPALITGRDLHWADRDVPSIVVAAALHPSAL